MQCFALTPPCSPCLQHVHKYPFSLRPIPPAPFTPLRPPSAPCRHSPCSPNALLRPHHHTASLICITHKHMHTRTHSWAFWNGALRLLSIHTDLRVPVRGVEVQQASNPAARAAGRRIRMTHLRCAIHSCKRRTSNVCGQSLGFSQRTRERRGKIRTARPLPV